jgi:succinate-semialdehyde dehydrogenase / glutarate-semialdehyde dehydrogenase
LKEDPLTTDVREPAAPLRPLSSIDTDLFVGGRWQPAADRACLGVVDPADGSVLCSVADADVPDALAALDAAEAVTGQWVGTSGRARSHLLRRIHDALVEASEEFAVLITAEMGKPLAEARGEVAYTADFFLWYAEEAARITGMFRRSPDGSARHLTLKQPVGTCLLVTPWNFPLAMAARKIAPALAAGCTALLKPAEQTPLTALRLGQILGEAGVPGGVVSVLPTTRPAAVCQALMRDPRIRKVSFTGSTQVGRLLLEQAAVQVQRTSMELGGNAPFVVFDDADVEAAVEGALLAKMRNGGQSCVAANRFLVHETVAADFASRLGTRMSQLCVGPGTAPGTDVGPLIDARQLAKVADLVDDAVSAGATVLTGAHQLPGSGYYYAPTVLTDVPCTSRAWSEEIFGPVAAIYTFQTDEEAIAMANDTDYGLVAYLYTQDSQRAFNVGEALQTGMVGLNRGLVSDASAPFGGTKHSGLGKEGGEAGLEEYLETKYVAF